MKDWYKGYLIICFLVSAIVFSCKDDNPVEDPSDETLPEISGVNRDISHPTPDDAVTVSATVTASETCPLTVVTLKWRLGTAQWSNIEMTKRSGGVYSATIPKQAHKAEVTYKIFAVNKNGSRESIPASYTVMGETPPIEGNFTAFRIKRSLNPALGQDIEFTIDHNNLTIEGACLRWINSNTPSLLIVSFEASGIQVELGGDIIQNGETVVDFKKPVKFAITTENQPQRIYTATLICPQINATLPVLRINADGPIQDKVNYVKANLEIVGNGIDKGLWDFNREKIDIRLRGNATLWLPKKAYRIKFPEKYSPLGLNHAKEKNWVLLANDCDKSLIRNAVAFQISRIMQSGASYRRFTPCTQFVDVYLNGYYEGNYHLTDQVQRAPGRVNVQSLTAADAGNASKISGGYLLEIDGFANGDPLWFTSPKGMKVSVKHPDEEDYAQEQIAWITDYFTKTENALFSNDFKDPLTGWRKYINIDSWVDYCIINEMSGNSDAWWSTFMSKERDVDYFVMGPVWDFDIAFNNDNRIPNATTRLMANAAHDPKTWINRFMQDDTFKAALKARWNAKKGELRSVIGYVDELAKLLDMSQKANFKRWDIKNQVLGHANPAPASYQEAITQLKNYLEARYNFLDVELNK